MKREGITAEPGITHDNFDLIVNLVARSTLVSSSRTCCFESTEFADDPAHEVDVFATGE